MSVYALSDLKDIPTDLPKRKTDLLFASLEVRRSTEALSDFAEGRAEEIETSWQSADLARRSLMESR